MNKPFTRFNMEDLKENIEIWNKKFNTIKDYKLTQKSLEIIQEDVSFKILFPVNKSDFITVDSDYDISWLDNLNMKIIEKNYSTKDLEKILTIINNQIKKVNKIYPKKKSNSITISSDMKIIDENEINFLKIKNKINTILQIEMDKTQESTSPNDKKLFDRNTVLKILSEEFLDLYKKSLNTSKFKLYTGDNFKLNSWKIYLKNFTNSELKNDLSKLNEDFSYNYIEININFNEELYPNYPPKIEYIRPKFKNSLSYKLSNLKMIQLNYWSPARSVEFIINKLHTILDKFGKIDIENANKTNSNSYTKLENALIELSNHYDQKDDELDTEKYEKLNFTKTSKKSTVQHWKNGTGYGHRGANDWDIDAFIASQKQKEIELTQILDRIYKEICQVNDYHKETIKESFLVKFIISKLEGNTLFEIGKNIDSYTRIIDILDKILLDFSEQIEDEDFEKIYKIIKELYSDISIAAKHGSQDDLSIKLTLINSRCETLNQKFLKNKEDTIKNNEEKNNKEKIGVDKYKNELEKYKFIESPIIFEGCKYFFQKEFDSMKNRKVTYQKRMVQELSILRKSVPIEFGASIYIAMDPENISVLRVLITGPHDTPYDSGCFIFDVFIPQGFPTGPPLVYMLNTGNVRFNPNLYDSGKVCLSILGTWEGSKGETWNKDTSSLLQVFMSIQSLILIDEPYFNEPSYENTIGTDRGRVASKNYNNKIRMYTMRHAMKDLINSTEYPQFKEIIKNHFRNKKDHILKVCQKWVNDAPTDHIKSDKYGKIEKDGFNKEDYEIEYDKLKKALDSLDPDLDEL